MQLVFLFVFQKIEYIFWTLWTCRFFNSTHSFAPSFFVPLKLVFRHWPFEFDILKLVIYTLLRFSHCFIRFIDSIYTSQLKSKNKSFGIHRSFLFYFLTLCSVYFFWTDSAKELLTNMERKYNKNHKKRQNHLILLKPML